MEKNKKQNYKKKKKKKEKTPVPALLWIHWTIFDISIITYVTHKVELSDIKTSYFLKTMYFLKVQ